MKLDFTDNSGRHYQFDLGAESCNELLVKVTVRLSVSSGPAIYGSTFRPIVNGKVHWNDESENHQMISLEARHYLDKVIKNKAFL